MAREHGGRAAFRQPHCQHPVCVATRNRQKRREKERRVYGTKVYVDAEPARRHVVSLLANGMTRPAIADLATQLSGTKVDRTQIRNLVVGQPPRQPPAKMLRPETAAALLMVPLAHGAVRESGWVDATGSRRRIEALNVIGYHDTFIAPRIGSSPANFASLRRRPDITAAKANAIRDLYDRLKDTEGPAMRTPKQKFVQSCRRKGYLAPIWWDDDNIDDPTYDPLKLEAALDELMVQRALDGEDVNHLLTRQERVEVVLRLHDRGVPPTEIRKRLHEHINKARIEQIIQEHREQEEQAA